MEMLNEFCLFVFSTSIFQYLFINFEKKKRETENIFGESSPKTINNKKKKKEVLFTCQGVCLCALLRNHNYFFLFFERFLLGTQKAQQNRQRENEVRTKKFDAEVLRTS